MKSKIAGVLALIALSSIAQAKTPLRVCMVSGSFEYNSDESLAPFKKELEERYGVTCDFVTAGDDWENLPGLEALEECDVALFFTRRLRIEGEQLERVKKYCRSGKPVVGVRTASHGFQNYLEFDKEVLGGNYHNHHGKGPRQKLVVESEAADHPILKGVGPLDSKESLYKTAPLAPDCQLVMKGIIPDTDPEPVVWTRERAKGRVVYIGIGGSKDFANKDFKRLLTNSLFWAAGRETPER